MRKVMQSAFHYENDLGLRGGLKIECDPNIDVYIGDRRVGIGSVELSWDELLGTSESQPLAVPISDAPSPMLEQLSVTGRKKP